MWKRVFLSLLTGQLMWTLIHCHPQCLDFKPPFHPEQELSFCSEYSNFGCCTKRHDNEIRLQYTYTRSRLSSSLSYDCYDMLKELLCQKCSPYAAHIYDAETTLRPRTFPGLCLNYCSVLYQNCKEIVSRVSTEQNLMLQLSIGEEQFCRHVQLTDLDYCYPDLLTNDVLNNKVSISQITSEGCLCVEEFASGLSSPVLARHAGDESHRLFIAEQKGLVYIYYLDGRRELKPFLDLRKSVMTSSDEGDERGFLGMAFHPQYAHNRKFYVYYSTSTRANASGETDHKIRISEFTVLQYNANKADKKSERVILEVDQPYWNHNGGEILFGDDGYLYLFIGDGGAGGDPHGNSQNLSTLLGKVLRININQQTALSPYGIPPDNPFLGNHKARPEIYAYGVRNIWRCGKDRGDPQTGYGKGRVICGDVGQSAFEEIDMLKKGANYGWNAREGPSCFLGKLCGKIGEEEWPIFSYPHAVGKSVTGGHIYRGCHNPNLNGFYFYGDYMNGRLFRLVENRETSKWQSKEVNMCGPDLCTPPLNGTYLPHILSFGEDEDGEIYLLSTGYSSAFFPGGKVYKLVDPSRRGNPEICVAARTPQERLADRYNVTEVPDVSVSRPANRAPMIRMEGIRLRTCTMIPAILCTMHRIYI
ncbi:hypothetical protein ScPMuIL_014435 [Solemya velum]